MNRPTTPIDPAVRGLMCCLIDLEDEARALGHGLTANLIAAASLSLVPAEGFSGGAHAEMFRQRPEQYRLDW